VFCLRFLWAKGLDAKDIHKEMFPVYGGKCLSRKLFTLGLRNFLKDVRKLQMMPNQVWKWLRQESKELYAAGFDALVKRWDKHMNVCGYVKEKKMFFPGLNITFYILCQFVIYLLTPSYYSSFTIKLAN
jgi:hypothetical protein